MSESTPIPSLSRRIQALLVLHPSLDTTELEKAAWNGIQDHLDVLKRGSFQAQPDPPKGKSKKPAPRLKVPGRKKPGVSKDKTHLGYACRACKRGISAQGIHMHERFCFKDREMTYSYLASAHRVPVAVRPHERLAPKGLRDHLSGMGVSDRLFVVQQLREKGRNYGGILTDDELREHKLL